MNPSEEILLQNIQEEIWSYPTEAKEICPHCNGLGVIHVNVPVGHPAFGRSFFCGCQRTRIEAKRIAELGANIPARYHAASLDYLRNLPPQWQMGKIDMCSVADFLMRGEPMITDSGKERPGAVLSGPCGVGKSSIAAVIARGVSARGVPVMWRDFTEIYERDIKGTYRKNGNTLSVIETIGHAPFLIIDEMGHTQRTSPLRDDHFEKTQMILRKRWEKMLPTVITTNLTLKEFYQRFGDPIADRVTELCHWITVGGVNLRHPETSAKDTSNESSTQG